MVKFLHRFCSGERAIQVLKDRTVYLAPPSSLNDPFEFTGMVDIECTQDDRKVLLDYVARNQLKLSEEQIKQSEEKRQSMSESDFWIYLLSWEVRGLLRFLYQFSGVSCFTRHFDHPLLWSHYADSHKGVCLVFNNLDNLCPLFKFAAPVEYTDLPPKIRLLDYYLNKDNFINDIHKVFHTKQSAWSYENEWRVVIPSREPMKNYERLLHFEEQHLCKVILGDKVAPEIRKEIRTMGNGRRFPLLVYQAKVLEANYGLAFKLLPPNADYPDHSAWHKLPDPGHDSPFPPFFPKLNA